jgi:hypothetical protein
MEQLATITSRLDAQAADTRQLMHRDALCDHLAPIVADQPFMPPKPPLAPPLFRHDSPDTPQCLHLPLDQPHVEDAASQLTMSSLVAQLMRMQISTGTPSIGP